ncbi:neutral zinc metallopeptidase [Streptosporangium saharense]|uniref:neutral zinc metallopeptidase n=1 Tax=Streptosporangium saharense TaxID=1706840 RepID=UPI00331B8B2D
MRTLFAALTAGVLVGAVFTGTADASPSGSVPSGPGALTRNPVYKTGKFLSQTCEEPDLRVGDVETLQTYADDVSACLNRAWSAQLKRAGIPFRTPKVAVGYGEAVRTACGVYRPAEVFGLYCHRNRTVYLLTTEYGMADVIQSSQMLESLSIAYAYHVQNLIGVLAEGDRVVRKSSRSAVLAMNSKTALQNICFTGAFVGSVWESLENRKARGVESFLNEHTMEGDTPGLGRNKNRLYWLRRGFEARSPAVCNTFTAPRTKVA